MKQRAYQILFRYWGMVINCQMKLLHLMMISGKGGINVVVLMYQDYQYVIYNLCRSL